MSPDNLYSNGMTHGIYGKNMFSPSTAQNNDAQPQSVLKKKIRMNSEEKLMAKKIKQANNAVILDKAKDNRNKIGSSQERKLSARNHKNTSESNDITHKNISETNLKNSESSIDIFKQYIQTHKLSGNNRVGSPVTEPNKNEKDDDDDDDTYYEKEVNTKLKIKNLRINSDNNRKEPLLQYPFPLTPLDIASNKPIEFEDNIGGVKSQSTRNK